jgi:hypothetical protein
MYSLKRDDESLFGPEYIKLRGLIIVDETIENMKDVVEQIDMKIDGSYLLL